MKVSPTASLAGALTAQPGPQRRPVDLCVLPPLELLAVVADLRCQLLQRHRLVSLEPLQPQHLVPVVRGLPQSDVGLAVALCVDPLPAGQRAGVGRGVPNLDVAVGGQQRQRRVRVVHLASYDERAAAGPVAVVDLQAGRVGEHFLERLIVEGQHG